MIQDFAFGTEIIQRFIIINGRIIRMIAQKWSYDADHRHLWGAD
jgi:hypothetical protein